MQKKKILFIVDVQNDFITGSLATKEASKTVPNIKKKVDLYRQQGFDVIFTRDTHFDDYLETPEGKHLPVKHCISGTEGWQIESTLNADNEDDILNKELFGTFKLADYIDNDIEEVEICGFCTDICVVTNSLILKTQFPDLKVTVDANCCAGVTPELHQSALDVMKSCQINVVE